MTAVEEICDLLYRSYKTLMNLLIKKAKPVDSSNDEVAYRSIRYKAPSLLKKLTDGKFRTCEKEFELITNAKGHYANYATIKGRNPELQDTGLDRTFDRLMWVVSKREAEMLTYLGYGEYDLQSIFEQKEKILSLANCSAQIIVASALKKDEESKKLPALFATDTGKKFHNQDCPFCAGRTLTPTTPEKIKARELSPCKCLHGVPSVEEVFKPCITVFVDESIRPTPWKEGGKENQEGCFSYIAVNGYLLEESEIAEERVITRGIDYTSEKVVVSKVTETAIGKVLFMLKYEYNYSGKVLIYSDNQTCVDTWQKNPINCRLTAAFESVTVKHIPRELNTKADALCSKKFITVVDAKEYEKLGKAIRLLREIG
ncbi:hypothetical protein SAMN02910339_01350 [Lachnospiraceae bacterium YSD2013]|nr:hypothetical protein SAMN02910339_01350 [Lachnospiraceae bacterium YSD2013]